jgi:hypothetical protein
VEVSDPILRQGEFSGSGRDLPSQGPGVLDHRLILLLALTESRLPVDLRLLPIGAVVAALHMVNDAAGN